jgi:thiamine-monophosphate kinase
MLELAADLRHFVDGRRVSRVASLPVSSPTSVDRLIRVTRLAYDVFALPLPERKLISRIRTASCAHLRLSKGHPVVIGIGDDASVLRVPKNHEILVTTDFSLEGVHFRREWHPPESLGHRCLARGLSDIAAMGGEPIAAFLSLALPRKLQQRWVDRFLKGLLVLANRHNVKLAGGDTAASPTGVLADILVIGSVPRGQALVRSGAKPGDRIYVTGDLGGSAAVLDQLFSGRKSNLQFLKRSRHFFPEPRINVGRVLREKQIATSMIDLSDGLSTDLAHICEESGCGAEIRQELIPLAKAGKPAHEVDPKLALHGGEDYELLFTASPKTSVPRKIAGVPVSQIGIITRGNRRSLIPAAGANVEFEPHGWEHFRS